MKKTVFSACFTVVVGVLMLIGAQAGLASNLKGRL